MSLHPEVMKEIEAGPQMISGPIVMNEQTLRPETPEEFARRIAALAVEKEREECAKVCDEAAEYHRRFADSVSQFLCVSNASAIRRRGKP